MKLNYPQLKEEYDYIIENILPESIDEENGWFNEYIDY